VFQYDVKSIKSIKRTLLAENTQFIPQRSKI
jgi:hypothetical protein